MEFIILVVMLLIALGSEKTPNERKVAVARNRIRKQNRQHMRNRERLLKSA